VRKTFFVLPNFVWISGAVGTLTQEHNSLGAHLICNDICPPRPAGRVLFWLSIPKSQILVSSHVQEDMEP
jgi:hypothetical protein